METNNTARKRYQSLSGDRIEYVNRAEEISQLTIPWVFINRENMDDSKEGELINPFSSVGARGCRNLSSRFTLSLLPTNEPFFRYLVDDSILDELPEEITRGDIEQALGKISRIIKQWMDKSNLRVEAASIFLQLLVTGNPLFFIDEDLTIHSFSLDQFVIRRDRPGKIIEIVVKEVFDYSTLPDNIKDIVTEKCKESNENNGAPKKKIEVYTWVKLNKEGKYESVQETMGVAIEETRTVYPKGINPWIAPRLIKISGEHYGRPYCEEYIGDLRAVNGLDESLLNMAAAASRCIIFQSPTSTTDTDDLNNAPSGSVVPGDARDFAPMPTNITGDFTVVKAQSSDIQQRLAQAFLLVSAIQRNAERVTAEEIRLMAEELNNSLGGIYSVLSSEFQKPLVETFQYRLKKSGVIQVPEDVEVSLVTGLEALGKGQDLSRLNGAINQLLQLQQAGINSAQFINANELIARIFAGNGIDSNGLIKTQEQVSQEQQQAAMQDSLMNGKMGDIAQDVVNAAGQPQQENGDT